MYFDQPGTVFLPDPLLLPVHELNTMIQSLEYEPRQRAGDKQLFLLHHNTGRVYKLGCAEPALQESNSPDTTLSQATVFIILV